VVWRESAFDETAKGAAGELGLMQIRWMAAKDWATSESLPWHSADFLRDPGTNTLVGTWYLSRLLQRYSRTDNPLPYALADYNAGRSNVLRWAKGEASTNSQEFMRQITFPGTRKYILTISARMKIYQRQFETAAFAQAQ
jgi:soluble lytic murein transglycosylase